MCSRSPHQDPFYVPGYEFQHSHALRTLWQLGRQARRQLPKIHCPVLAVHSHNDLTLIGAGCQRGRQVAEQLGLAGQAKPLASVAEVLQAALGKDGTRLCIVDKIVEDGDKISVYCRETICSAGEPEGSPRNLTFTLGAVQGVVESVTGKRLRGKQTESVLRGSAFDVIEFEVIG